METCHIYLYYLPVIKHMHFSNGAYSNMRRDFWRNIMRDNTIMCDNLSIAARAIGRVLDRDYRNG